MENSFIIYANEIKNFFLSLFPVIVLSGLFINLSIIAYFLKQQIMSLAHILSS
ncbi:MAG: hypothetical protein AABX77_02345 [Nanoarchaeota archaeon]